jgi:Tol biopolymer transport system component
MNRLTYDGRVGSGTWFSDGVRIVHTRRSPGGGVAVVVRRLDGVGGERVIARAPHPLIVTDVTPDGGGVIYCDYGQRTGRIRLAAVEGDTLPREIPGEGEGYEMAARLSPDGRWLAYVTTKTRREEVCVRRLDGSGASWQLSTGQGGGPRWGRDGASCFWSPARP